MVELAAYIIVLYAAWQVFWFVLGFVAAALQDFRNFCLELRDLWWPKRNEDGSYEDLQGTYWPVRCERGHIIRVRDQQKPVPPCWACYVHYDLRKDGRFDPETPFE